MSKHLAGKAVREMAVACFKGMLKILSRKDFQYSRCSNCFTNSQSRCASSRYGIQVAPFCAWISALTRTFKGNESDKPSKNYKADFCIEARVLEN